MNDQSERFPGDNDPSPIAKRGSAMKIIVIVVLVLVVLGGCLGGCIWGGWGLMDMGIEVSMKAQVEDTPAIKEHIGTIDDISLAWTETAQQASIAGQEERIACTVSGEKGSGLLIIEQGPAGIENPDWVILKMDGKSYVVLGSPPEDLGAIGTAEPKGDTASDETTTDSDSGSDSDSDSDSEPDSDS